MARTTKDRTEQRGYSLPPGWRKAARGVWVHENGARVESTGARDCKYIATDPDMVRVSRDTRAEAMAWASGKEQ